MTTTPVSGTPLAGRRASASSNEGVGPAGGVSSGSAEVAAHKWMYVPNGTLLQPFKVLDLQPGPELHCTECGRPWLPGVQDDCPGKTRKESAL